MRKIQIAARILSLTGIARVLLLLRPVFLPELRILVYHRITEIEDEAQYPFDSLLVSASIAEYEWQMEYVKKHFTPITFAQLIDFLDGNHRLPKRPVIITFDDGFDDSYYHAFPVLKALNVPATLFISTGYIGEKHTFWFDWLAYLILSTQEDEFCVTGLGMKYRLGSDSASRRRVYYSVVEKLKRIPNHQRIAVLKTLTDRYGGNYQDEPEHIKQLSRPLTWEQVREMVAHGIEFGSHTVSHPILTMLDDEELRSELEQSKGVIEKMTGQRIHVLAYPNGQRQDFDDRVRKASNLAGYRLGISYIRGLNHTNKIDLYGVKRMHPSPINDRYVFASTLALPEIF